MQIHVAVINVYQFSTTVLSSTAMVHILHLSKKKQM